MDDNTFYKSVNLLGPGFLIYLLGMRIPDLPSSKGYFKVEMMLLYCWCGNVPQTLNLRQKGAVIIASSLTIWDHNVTVLCPLPRQIPWHINCSRKQKDPVNMISWLYFKRQRIAAQSLIILEAGSDWLSEGEHHYLLKSERGPVPALFSPQKPIVEISCRVVAKGRSACREQTGSAWAQGPPVFTLSPCHAHSLGDPSHPDGALSVLKHLSLLL